eukprot:gene6405-6636_t
MMNMFRHLIIAITNETMKPESASCSKRASNAGPPEDEDLDVLDIAGRPEDLLLSVVPVPPVAIRPSVEMDGASNEDDVTMKLM